MTEPVMTKKDIAKRLGVSTKTVQRLKLPHTRVGGQNRYLWSEVAAHLGIAQAEQPAQPSTAEFAKAVQRLEHGLAVVQAELVRMGLELKRLREKTIKEDDD